MPALNPKSVWDSVNYRPHRAQLAVATSAARFRVAACGRRFGKSDIGGHELLTEAIYTKTVAEHYHELGKRREFWIVGPEYTDSEKEFRILWNRLKQLGVPFDHPGSYNNPEGSFMHISLWDGAFQVHAKSAKMPETLVGEGLHGVIMAEAAKLKEKVWVKFVRPMLSDFDGWALFTSTPEGKNWFYEAWGRGQDPAQSEWASWRMPSWMNPHVFKKPTRGTDVRILMDLLDDKNVQGSAEQITERMQLVVDPEIVSMVNDLTAESFNQEIGADFTEFVGRVFKEFDEEVHVADLTYEANYMHFGAVDYGYTNPNVWLFIQVDPWGNVDVLDEIYEPGLTADEFGDVIRDRGLHRVRKFYPDPADPGSSRQLETKLRIRSGGGTGGEIRDRVDAIREALKTRKMVRHLPFDHPDRLPRLRIDRRCKNTIREFNDYRYPERRSTILGDAAHENPMKKDDHTPEALGRFFAGWEGTPADGAGTSRVGRARIKSSARMM